MTTIALIGPDGAGKTTVAKRLEHALPLPVKYIYMGVNPDSSNVMLPTTRIIHRVKRALGAAPDTRGPRDPAAVDAKPRGIMKRLLLATRRGLALTNRLSEEWYRQAVASYHQGRGSVVVFDRHFFADYYLYDVASDAQERSLSRRIHGFVLSHLYPQPDLVIYLDAPAEVLFARKGEGTIATLERRRQDYLHLGTLIKDFVVVDVNRPEHEVVQNVAAVITEFHGRTTARQKAHDARA